MSLYVLMKNILNFHFFNATFSKVAKNRKNTEKQKKIQKNRKIKFFSRKTEKQKKNRKIWHFSPKKQKN